jgi:hypothetical protein
MSTPYSISEFNFIFFDHSSVEWRKNKKKVNGIMHYTCDYIHTNHKKCNKIRYNAHLCKKHMNLIKMK